MKKFTLLALFSAMVLAISAQEKSEEIVYVEDPSQGYLFNRFKDNWFVTGEIGGNIYFSTSDQHRRWTDRFDPAAGIYVGKWFSPLIATRIGIDWLQVKGLSQVNAPGVDQRNPMVNGYYKQQFNHFGPVFDVMFNITNWVRGYVPGRKYNLIAYAGAGGYWTTARAFEENPDGTYVDNGYNDMQDRILTFRLGVMNTWRITEQVQLALDIRYSGLDNHRDEPDMRWNKTSHDLQAYLGVTYLFKRREWFPPVVPICPEPENCDPIRAQLAAAVAKIADLEDQLAHCCEKCPVPEVVEEGPLATIYYPINIFKITRKDVALLEAVAQVMKDNPDKHYIITGWADNYTGNDKINTRLRNNRVNGVKKQLLKLGVPESQITATINSGNLCDLGEKYVALDRAVTIEEAR